LTREVEISANILTTAERVIIHVIASLLQLIAKSIVGIVKVEPGSALADCRTNERGFALFFLLTLQGLKFPRLSNAREWVIGFEEALVAA
jgi:hypothetical protein